MRFYFGLGLPVFLLRQEFFKRNSKAWFMQNETKFLEQFYRRPAITLTTCCSVYGCETWLLTLREERRLRVFENRVLRKVFGP